MSKLLDAWRTKYPGAYDNWNDADLALAIGTKYPAYVEQDPQFSKLYDEGQQRADKRQFLQRSREAIARGEGPPTEGGGLLKQTALGALQAIPATGQMGWSGLEMLATPTTITPSAPKVTPLEMGLGPFAAIPAVQRLVRPAEEALRKYAGQRAAQKAEDVANVEKIGQFSKGPDIARQAVSTTLQSAPILAIGGPGGITGMSVAAGMQQAAMSFDQNKKQWEQQGLDKSQAADVAVQQSILDGLSTFLTTRAFGLTGKEAVGKSLVGDVISQLTVKGINNTALLPVFRQIIVGVGKEMAAEFPEEAIDQAAQALLEKYTSNPDKTFDEVGSDALQAGTLGSLAAAGFVGPTGIVEAGKAVAHEPARRAALQRRRGMTIAPESTTQGIAQQMEAKARPSRQVTRTAAEALTQRGQLPPNFEIRKGGKPNALDTGTAQPVRSLRQKPQEGQAQVPEAQTSPQDDERRGQAIAQKFNLDFQGAPAPGRLQFHDPTTNTGILVKADDTAEDIRRKIEAKRAEFQTAKPEAPPEDQRRLDMLATKHDLTAQQAGFALDAFKGLPADASPEDFQKAYLKLAMPADMPVGLGSPADLKGAKQILSDLREAAPAPAPPVKATRPEGEPIGFQPPPTAQSTKVPKGATTEEKRRIFELDRAAQKKAEAARADWEAKQPKNARLIFEDPAAKKIRFITPDIPTGKWRLTSVDTVDQMPTGHMVYDTRLQALNAVRNLKRIEKIPFEVKPLTELGAETAPGKPSEAPAPAEAQPAPKPEKAPPGPQGEAPGPAEVPPAEEVKTSVDEGATATGKSPSQIKKMLVDRAHAKIMGMAKQAAHQATNVKDEPNTFIAENDRGARGDLSDDGKKLDLRIYGGGGATTHLTVPVSSKAEAQAMTTLASMVGKGKVSVEVPGDGKFTVPNSGEHLLGLLKRLRSIKTTGGGTPTRKTSGKTLTIAQQASLAVDTHGTAAKALEAVTKQLAAEEEAAKAEGSWNTAKAARHRELIGQLKTMVNTEEAAKVKAKPAPQKKATFQRPESFATAARIKQMADAYSPGNQIRKMITVGKEKRTVTDVRYALDQTWVGTWKATPKAEWKGDSYTQQEVYAQYERGTRERGDQNGMIVTLKGRDYVLSDPMVYTTRPKTAKAKAESSRGSYPLEIPGSQPTTEQEARSFAQGIGFDFKVNSGGAAITMPDNLDALPAELQQRYKAIFELNGGPSWEFTDRSPLPPEALSGREDRSNWSNPTAGLTFNAPAGSSIDTLRARYEERLRELGVDPAQAQAKSMRNPTTQSEFDYNYENQHQLDPSTGNDVEPPPVAQQEASKPLSNDYPNIYETTDEELADILNEGMQIEPSRRGKYTFDTYDAFKSYMDARYGERDLEGMRLAFTEADGPWKIKYIRENQKAGNDHKKAWISHLATGSPVPTTDPPMPRTTPRPTASGTPEAPRPQAPTEPPPPPPDSPERFSDSVYAKFDTTALIQLLKEFGKYPTVNRRILDYGRYVHAHRRGAPREELPIKDMIELKQRLFYDEPFARRVLAHESGHFFDIGTRETGYMLAFGERMTPAGIDRSQIADRQTLLQDAKRLSAEWRGPFSPTDEYRNSAPELMADFLSAFLVNPDWVNRKYPRLHDAFEAFLKNKTPFKEAFDRIQGLITGDTLVDQVRGNMDKASDKTLEKLLEDDRQGRGFWKSAVEAAYGGLLTQWHRAIQKEGRVRVLGDSLKDYLETSHTWAILQDQILADDFQRLVMPHLRQVAGVDPNKPARKLTEAENAKLHDAMKLLNQFSQANRTIGERRVAGKWIEDNPGPAREFLETVLAASPSLNQEFGSALRSTPDNGLYDFAAKVFRRVHDKGKDFVSHLSTLIDQMDLPISGEDAMMAFNVRGKLLNPEGLTVETAQKILDRIRSEIGDERYQALSNGAREAREIFFQLQKAAYQEGLIRQSTWEKLIVPNRDNYMPYAVLDYFDGKVRAGIMAQHGTAKEIADTTVAMQLKAASLNSWRQRQRQVALVKAMYEKGGHTVEVGRTLRRISDLDGIRRRHAGDDISRAVYWVDGKPHLIEFPGDPGKTLEAAFDNPSFYQHMEWLGKSLSMTHMLMQMYTTLNSSFMLFRNPVRGSFTTAERIGARKTLAHYNPFSGKFWDSVRLGFNYAGAAFGNVMDPRVRSLVESEALPPPRLASSMIRDVGNLRDLMSYGAVMANMARRVRSEVKTSRIPKWLHPATDAALATQHFFDRLFTAYEAFEKIQAFKVSEAKGMSAEESFAMTRRAGIPRPGVGGHWSMPMEIFLPFTRVHIQGLRSTAEVAMDPKKRAGFLTRFTAMELAPRMLRYLMGLGLVSGAVMWALRKDEDKEDRVMGEVVRRISPYKLALDNIIPLALYDPRTGEYHYFTEYRAGRDIPPHFEVVSLRVPSSEEGRLFGPLFYQMLINAGPGSDKLKRPTDSAFSAMGNWAANYMLPGINPMAETGVNLVKVAEGKNPNDSYTGQPVVNPQLFDAGGTARLQGALGYMLQRGGGPGQLAATIAMNTGVLDPRAATMLTKRYQTDKTPFMQRFGLTRSMTSYDNYAQYREGKIAELEEKKIRARARMVMSDEVRDLYDFYWRNYDRRDQLDAVDFGKLKAASDFVNTVWGKLDSPDSYYNKAAYAAMQGSSDNRRTVREDLDLAAAPYMETFLHPDSARFVAVLHLSNKDTVKATFDAKAYQEYEKILEEQYQGIDEKLSKNQQYQILPDDQRKSVRNELREYGRQKAAALFLERHKPVTR